MRKSVLTLLASATWLFVASSGAAAFTEVKTEPEVPGIAVGNAPEELGQRAGTRVQDRLPALHMIDPSASAADSEGTVLSIPGIGQIGTLPKFDFGLELLYGAPEQGALQFEDKATRTGEPAEEDVIIRGTIKHRF